MASVFLSYDHKDSDRAAPIAAAFEAHGHSVWWDRQIHGGAQYASEIERAVERSDAVVVLWSANSILSAWVRDEAAEGRDRGRLIPVLLDAVKPPMGFRQFQTIDLLGWNGGKRIPHLPDLLLAIEKVADSAPASSTNLMALQPKMRAAPMPTGNQAQLVSRRMLLGVGAATAALIGGGGLWWASREGGDPRFAALIDEAQEAVRKISVDERTAKLLEKAVAMRPQSSKALGLLALVDSLIAQNAHGKTKQSYVEQAQNAALRAVSIDPREPNALLAMFELQGSILDWFSRDQKLRQIIATDPKNVVAISELVLLTQATGMCRESWQWNERAIGLEPLSADFLGKRALKLWILGRTSQADKVADQVRALYPADPWIWFVRLHIYAFTGRVAAAEAMLDSDPAASARPELARLWRTALGAMDHPTAPNIDIARQACIDGAQISPLFASEAITILAALRDLDTAFDLANEFLFSRGPLVGREKTGPEWESQRAAWRVGTQWMFTPPVAPIRADPRFIPLCDAVGLIDYWRKRGMKPDYQRL